jgi:acyl carrier protein
MSTDETEAIVRALMMKHLEFPSGEVDFDASVEEAGDSLQVSELVVAIEQRFGIEISDASVARVRTLRDLLELVHQGVVAVSSASRR